MIDNHHQQYHQIVPRSTTGGGPVETSGIGASRSQQFNTTTTTTTKPGDNRQPGDLPEKSVSERLSSEKKKPEVKAKPKLPKVIPVVKKVDKKS